MMWDEFEGFKNGQISTSDDGLVATWMVGIMGKILAEYW